MILDYQKYLSSSHWNNIKKNYKLNRKWECLCGEKYNLQLHHKHYRSLGKENFDDLQPLCQSCHSLVHDLNKQGLLGLDLNDFSNTERKVKYRIERGELDCITKVKFLSGNNIGYSFRNKKKNSRKKKKVRCKGMTVKNKRCKQKCINGWCKQHKKQVKEKYENKNKVI